MLYDLENDPAENVNISRREDMKEIVEKLSNELTRIKNSMND
jgi:hypothetical protein